MLDRKFLLGTTLIAGLSAAALVAPTVAVAQTTTAAPAAAPAADGEEEEDDGDVAALVVTGSRIKRSEFTSSSPVQIVTSQQSVLEGVVDTAEIVQQSSVASGSFQVNNQMSGYVVGGGQNVSTISLRGLGAVRTLVLLNGRRMPPSGTGGTTGPVDLGVIPFTVIERVEILKDGASSIYGSDAVAGVVNYITKKDTDGIDLEVYASIPLEGAAESYTAAATWGKVFDRGFLNASLSYTDQKVLKKRDRDETACAADYFTSAATGARVDFIDPATGKYKCYNAIQGGWQAFDIYGGTFAYDPTLANAPPGGYPAAALTTRAFLPDWVRHSRAGQPATYAYGEYDSDKTQDSDVISPIKRLSVYLTGGFDITPTTEAYGEFLYSRREDSATYTQYLFEYVDPTNPNNTVAAGLQAGGATGYARPLILFPYQSDQEIDYVRALGGLRGSVPIFGGWDWDIYGMYGKSDASYRADFIYQDRVFALTGPGLACDQSMITISGGSCASLPGGIPFFTDRVLHGNLTDAEAAFLKGKETGTTEYTQWLIEGSIAGDLFTLPAGPVGAAFGFTLRNDEIDDNPGFNARKANYWGFSTSGRTAGDDFVKEIYGEFDIPVAKGLPGIESLNVNLSGRYTDYDSYGSDSTYKVGVNWQITPSWRIRATHGTSFRAPALYELYLADQTSFTSAADPCIRYEESSNDTLKDNCAAAGIPIGYGGPGSTIQVQSGGGGGLLKAETSKATTIGVIWTPSFIDLSVAVEYFDIEVNDEVAKFGASNIMSSCYGGKTFPNDYCSLITRDPVSKDITLINDNYLNINSQLNRGIDLTFRYEHELDFGRFVWDNQFTWQVEDVVQLLQGNAQDYNGSTTEPDFTGISRLRFERGDWTVNWSTQFIGKTSDSELINDVVSSTKYNTVIRRKVHTEFTAYHTASIQKKWGNASVTMGIQNLFDDGAPAQSSGQFRNGTAALNMYRQGIVGRTVFIGLTKRF